MILNAPHILELSDIAGYNAVEPDVDSQSSAQALSRIKDPPAVSWEGGIQTYPQALVPRVTTRCRSSKWLLHGFSKGKSNEWLAYAKARAAIGH